MSRQTGPLLCLVLLIPPVLVARPAAAQGKRSLAIEAHGGYAGFLDESMIDHAVVGGSLMLNLTPRLRIGPELTWMRGPGADRDLFITGTLAWDLRGTQASTRVMPYLIAGGGCMRHSNRFGDERFSGWEGAWTGGAGVRFAVTPQVTVAPEFRIGWEPHYRLGVTVGIALRETRSSSLPD
jgi:hypothetical protein